MHYFISILYGVSIVNILILQMRKLDEINNLPRSHRLGKNGGLRIKSGTQIFISLNSLYCTPFPSLVTLVISFCSHKVICCIRVYKQNVCVHLQSKIFYMNIY